MCFMIVFTSYRENLNSLLERNVARPLYSGYSKAKCNYELILINVLSGNWCIFVQSGELHHREILCWC